MSVNVAEWSNATDSKSVGETRAGSNPAVHDFFIALFASGPVEHVGAALKDVLKTMLDRLCILAVLIALSTTAGGPTMVASE